MSYRNIFENKVQNKKFLSLQDVQKKHIGQTYGELYFSWKILINVILKSVSNECGQKESILHFIKSSQERPQ